MKTEFEILKLIEDDMRTAARREGLLGPDVTSHRRRRVSWGGLVAAFVALLVVAGTVGWLAQGGGPSLFRAVDEAGAGGNATAETGAAGVTGSTGAVAVETPLEDGSSELDSAPAPQATPAPAGYTDETLGLSQGSDQFAAIGGTGAPHQELSKIIRDGSIAIRVIDGEFSKGFASVTRIAQNNGGFVLTSTTTRERAGTLTLRIPAKRFDQAMLALRALGIVERQQITGRDVTAQFIDLNARLDILQQRKALLLELQADATTSAEILRLATLVQRTQLDIERIQGELNFLNDQVAQATIKVSLHEANARSQNGDDPNPSLGNAWNDAIDGFLAVVAAVVVGLGFLIPVGVIGLAIFGITVWVRKRRAAS